MAAKFGTSGLRGLVEELIGPVTQDHVRAFIRYLKAKRLAKTGDAVFVGLDFRASSPALHEDVATALAMEGMREVSLGAVPTPALAFEAMAKKSAAIMITGSHIPADRNGIKFYTPDGEITKADEKAIVALVKKLPAGKVVPVKSQSGNVRGFVARNKKAFVSKSLKGMRVGVYQHSSVARDMLVELLRTAGAEVTALARSEIFIPVDTEAVSDETLRLLKGWGDTGKYDAFVSADGDGDRPLIADEHGDVLRGDLLGLITARFLKAQNVVTPITSNSGLDAHLPEGTLRTKVGSPFVIDAMMKAKKRGAKGIVGFEANGGFFTASRFKLGRTLLSPLPTRDCFLPIMAVLVSARKAKNPLSQFATQFGLPEARAGRLENFVIEKSAALMKCMSQSSAQAQVFFADFGKIKKRNMIDGLRLTFANGEIIHLRPSGNAPEFRCYVEAASAKSADDLLVRAMKLLEAQR